MKKKHRYILVIGLILFAFLSKDQAAAVADAWAEKKALRSMLQNMRSEVVSPDHEIKIILQELKVKPRLSSQEESLVRELELILKQREILALSGKKKS